jgi:O-antigen ligase
LILKYQKIIKPADKISQYGFLYSFKNIFNLSLFRYPIENFYHTLVIFNFPFFYNLFRNNFNTKTLIIYIKRLSIFSIISAIPFHLHLLEPLGSAYRISNFDTSYGASETGYVGIFQNAHGASIITTFAVINLIFFYKREKILSYLVVGSLGILNVYMTYVRTGYVLLIIGLTLITLFGTKFYEKFRVILIGTIALVILLYFADTELLINRLFNINKYNVENRTINYNVEALSSGRTLFWVVNITNWWESDILLKMFGFGEEVAKDNMEKTIGMRLFSHNGFIDSFIENGLIGLFLFIGLFYYILKLVINNKGSTFFYLGIASFIMFILMNLFQGGYYFLMEIFIVLNLSLLNNHVISNNKLSNIKKS